MALQAFKRITREVKQNQWLVLAAWSLTLVAFCFCLSGLLGVWWSGDQDLQEGGQSIKLAFSSTLWETESTAGAATTATQKIDDSCGKDELPEDDKATCSKIKAVRAFVFMKLFAVFLALSCPVAWFVLQRLRGDDASSLLQKHLLTVSIISNAFASLCALIATCIAPSLDFGNMDGVGAAGAGYVLTILSMIFCLFPAIILECCVWRKVSCLSSGTAETKASSPPDSKLPTLVASGASKDDAVNV
jgi:hypothetical protein